MSSIVSIIIPTYNRGHLIGETLDSILAQTYTHWECIIVDDGSSDATDQVVGSYVAKDARFKYFHRPNSHLPGGNGARNFGFLQSQGEYIQWFDSDDIMYEEHLNKKVAFFQDNNNIDVVFCAYHYFDISGLKNRISNNYFSGNVFDDLAESKLNFTMLSFMIKKNAIVNFKFNEKLKKAQDLDFLFRFFSKSSVQVLNITTPLYKIRKGQGNSISERVDKKGEKIISKHFVNNCLLGFYDSISHRNGYKKYYYEIHKDFSNMLVNKNNLLAVKFILKSQYVPPFKKIKYLLFVLTFLVFGKGRTRIKENGLT